MSVSGARAEFTALVKDALTHLLDVAHLQSHPLSALFLPGGVDDPRVRAQLLRETFLQAIGDLKPPDSASTQDLALRPYLLLTRRYVQGFPGEKIQAELAIGRRQYFREQRRAVKALTEVLWDRRITDTPVEDDQQYFGDELEELGLEPTVFALDAAVADALEALRGLADERGTVMSLVAHGSARVHSDEDITRQLLVSLLSGLVQLFPGSYMQITLRQTGRWVDLVIRETTNRAFPGEPSSKLGVALTLAARVGGQLLLEPDNGQVVLRLPSAQRDHIVIVDDNAKTLRLFRRYLEPYRYRVTEIENGTEALAQITSLKPDAVVLDIMMRGTDGWRILQRLKADPETRDMAVIVCSVLAEEELARAVGADAYLRKPVTQSALLMALAQIRRE